MSQARRRAKQAECRRRRSDADIINVFFVLPPTRVEVKAAVCTADKHHVGCASPVRHHAGQHVNVVISRSAGVIDGEEYHSIQSCRIDPTETEEATHVNGSALVKSWRLGRDLRIARA